MKKPSLISLAVLLAAFVCTAKADYSIYPVPQKLAYTQGQTIQMGPVANVVCESGIDNYTIDRLKEVFEQENSIKLQFSKKASSKLPNVYLGISGSGEQVDKYVKRNCKPTAFSQSGKYDRHYIKVGLSPKGKPEIIVLGEHTNAVFFGLASLEQILEQSRSDNSGTTALQPLEINDHADMQYRGIVEGYYGYPYSFSVKNDLIKFFKRFKLNTYLYGAKSDPFHSGYWRKPYPTEISSLQEKNGWLSQDMIRDISKASIEAKVNFIWAIHPNSGTAVDYHTKESTAKAVSDVKGKFELMHSLGVRQFAVFLDDAGWDFNDVGNYRDFLTNLQTGLEAKYNRNYTNATDTVLPVHYVPHIYAINFAKEEDLKTYFDAISQTPSNVVVYTTGSGVWSSVKNEDFVTMEKLMKRPLSMWWNYPCNDNKDGRVYTADMYSTLQEMGLPIPDNDVPMCMGLVSNPMQQGTVSKICLFGVADYSWNTKAFDTRTNWQASFPAIVGKHDAPLYAFLAKYLRYQDSDELKSLINNYSKNPTAANKACLSALLQSVQDSTAKMLKMVPRDKSFELLQNDLKPWLRKLNKMASMANALLGLDNISDENERWSVYCDQVSLLKSFRTDTLYMVDALEGMGENPPSVMHPVEPCGARLMPFIESVVDTYYKLGFKSKVNSPVLTDCKTDSVIPTLKSNATDGVYSVEMTQPYSVQPKGSVLVTLPNAGTPKEVFIDKSLLKGWQVEYSLYGRDFSNFAKEFKANSPVKYIRFTNTSSKPRSLRLDKSVLRVVMPSAPQVELASLPKGHVYGNHNASMLVDGNRMTFASLYRDQRDGDCYTVKLKEQQPVYDVTVAFGTTNLDFPKVGFVQVSADSVNWRNLKVKGTDTEEFRMTLPQVEKINEDVSCCSFVGDGTPAKYVRFYLKESFQEKWLRLNEIEVNPSFLASQFVPVASASSAGAQSGFSVIPEVVDGKANTAYTPKDEDVTVTYNIFGAKLPSQLTVYAIDNAGGAGVAEVQVVCGAKTFSLGSLKNGVNAFSLDKYPNATAVTVRILGGSFSIAEIKENR